MNYRIEAISNSGKYQVETVTLTAVITGCKGCDEALVAFNNKLACPPDFHVSKIEEVQ